MFHLFLDVPVCIEKSGRGGQAEKHDRGRWAREEAYVAESEAYALEL
jgi:hypothetical protein